MRLLHVVPSYIPAYRYGGPIRSVHGLCKSLAARGHDVHVFTTNVDGPGDSGVPLGTPVDIDGVKVWYFPSRHLRRLYWSPSMDKAISDNIGHFDILHLHSIYLWPTWAAARAARRAHIPYMLSPRGMLERDLISRKSSFIKRAWIALIEKRNIECASGLHMTSRRESEEAKRFGFRLPPLFEVPNGLDAEEAVDAPDNISSNFKSMIEKKPLILFIGRINWKKGLDRLIPALKYVPSTHLVIAGNDEENYRPTLEALAVAHGVRDRITFTGPVQGADKAALLKNAEILVLPSYSENFGNVVLEAMAVGCPVAVTPEVGAADIVRKYRAGVVLDGEPSALANGIREMLANQQGLAEMGDRGRKAVEEHFTWEAVARQMEEVYTRVLQTPNATRG